jgi:hypothetical protein
MTAVNELVMAIIQKKAFIAIHEWRWSQNSNDVALLVDGIEVGKSILVRGIRKCLVFAVFEHVTMVTRNQVIRPYDFA